jgi:helicase
MKDFLLNPVQQEVMDHGLLTSGFSCVLQMPTGSGKTWLSALAIRSALELGHKVIYLSPLRALAEELVSKWSEEFDHFKVGIFTGDYGPQGRSVPVPYHQADLLIMTPERLDACTRNWRSHWSWIPQVDLVVVDELHLLGDPGRGARLEGTISRLRRLNPFVRILGLSATLGNRGEIADWLDGVEFGSEWRPVPLRWRVSRFKKANEKPHLLCEESAQICKRGGQSLVFVQSRRRSEALARHLCSQGIQAGYHHAGLQHSERRSVEEAFRTNQTPILVATGTLEMGLNLPARQVILYDLQGYDEGQFSPLATNTVWQRAGRAGRLGLDDEGEAVLFAPTWDKHVEGYARGRFEKIVSGLRDRAAFEEQLLVEIQSGMGRSRPQLERILSSTLAAHQKIPLPLDEAINDMTEAGIIDLHPDTSDFRVTPLGRIAIRQMLRPETVLQIRRFFESVPEPTFFDLLVAAAATGDCEPVISVDYEELETLADSLATRKSLLFCKGSTITPPATGKRLLSALKTATLLMDWTHSGDADAVALEFGCYPFEITRLKDSIERILMAMASVQRLLDPEVEGEEEKPKSPCLRRIELLRQMIKNGLEAEAASLTLVDGIGSVWARKLIGAGIRSLQELSSTPTDKVVALGGVSEKRAAAWIAEALLHNGSDALGDAPFGGLVEVHPSSLQLGVDPYRLRRAVELKVITKSLQEWTVSGGLDPHLVGCTTTPSSTERVLSCDCPDHAKGHTCKHILAVRLAQGDKELSQAVLVVDEARQETFLDLFHLWFSK